MARIGVTSEQVSAVADALIGEGKQATIRAVRERLGDRGSPNTIQKHLSAWRDARPMAAAAALELPQTLAAAIAAEIGRAAAQARAEIEGRLVEVQTEAADLAMTGESLEDERDSLIAQMAVLTTERDTLAGKAAQQAADLVELTGRVEREQQAAEAARVELATARLRAEGLTERHAAQGKEVEQLRAAVEDERKGRIAAEQAAAVLAARLEASAELVVRAETRAELAERQADQVTQDVRKAHAEREDARNLASQAREQGARLSGQVDVLQAESKRRDAVEAAQHAENERLRVELEALRARVPGDSGKGR
ncbi:MAG: DNA-binding protein [Giesbergeria sp.]|jgi:colicin import membrane protein